MKSKSKVLIIIPARGGSKGIPRKNLRILNGKPLLYYSIRNALAIQNAEVDCYVSSDDDEIVLMASKFGAKTINREHVISGDKITLDPVIYDAYTRIKNKNKVDYDYVITLQATSPLLKKESIELALEKMQSSDVDTIISGVFDSHLTWLESDGEFVPNYEKRVNRQELPKIYKETGGFVISKAKFIKENSRFGYKIEIFPLSKKEAIDIDDYDDWNLCEFHLTRKRVVFVVTGNSEVGMGHVYNTLSIANEILNHRIVFLVDKDSELAYNKIAESNYEVYIQQENDIITDIERLNPDVVINDILDTKLKYIINLKDKNYKVINFEDLGEGSSQADLVINAMYPEQKMALNHYYGSNYFILRDEFLYTPKKTIKPDVNRILISFGGVDPNNFTDRILKLIHQYCTSNKIEIVIITGMGYKHLDTLVDLYPEVTIKNNVKNISEEILSADIVFTSAGRTTFEVASIGVPSIVLCQNQRETTHFFASQKNGFYNLGLGSEVSDKEVYAAFTETMQYNTRVLMSEKMLNTRLRKGKSKVMKLINKTILN